MIVFCLHFNLRVGDRTFSMSLAPLQAVLDFTKEKHENSRLDNGEFIILPEIKIETRYRWYNFYFAPSLGWKIYRYHDENASVISVGPLAFSVGRVLDPI